MWSLACFWLLLVASLFAHASAHSLSRRHRRLSSQAKRATDVVLSGGGNTADGTFYYDITGGGPCGPSLGLQAYPENQGYAMCEPSTNPQTLQQRGTNQIVALPLNIMSGNLAAYCGKALSVTYNGKTIDNLIVWDGCLACNNNNGVDFSSTVFAELFGEGGCSQGRIAGITWEVSNKQLFDYPSGQPVADNGGDDGAGQTPPVVTPTVTSTTRVIRPTRTRTRTRQPEHLVADPKTTSTTSTSSSAEETLPSIREPDDTTTNPPTADDCTADAGQWRCSGNTLIQCVQSPSGFNWATRVFCKGAPINCDSANPVCEVAMSAA